MLKLLYATQIFNFRIFLTYLSPDLNHVVLPYLDALLNLRYMVGKFQISSFQPNFNCGKIPPVALDMSQTVHEGLVLHI